MQINVAGLLKSAVGAQRDYEVNETLNLLDGESLVEGTVTLVRTSRGILARANLATTVEISCSRCLGRYRQPLAIKIEEEFFPTIDIVSGTPLPPPDEPGSFIINEHHILDLDEAVRQYTLLVLPMKPLCREECAGICPTCGADRNQGACGCPTQQTDPRWAKLAKLLESDK